jgi:hypothetical protein
MKVRVLPQGAIKLQTEPAIRIFTGAGSVGLVPDPMENGDTFLSSDGTWKTPGEAVAPVDSVNGKTGVVVLNKADIGLGNVDNTSDANKPISSATQTALDLKVDKVTGKQLSDENYTLTEKQKLAGIANNANNYVHPNHSGDVVSVGDGTTTIQAGVVTAAKTDAGVQASLAKADSALQKDSASPNNILLLWSGTQAQYDALTPVASTLYFIEE